MERLNALIAQFELKEPAIGTDLVCGDIVRARTLGDSDYDFVMVDMEHEGFDLPQLGNTLQWLVSRRRMRRHSSSRPVPTPIVRIPANGIEHNEWIVKQVLDYGAFGIVLPHTQSGEQVRALVGAARYAQGPDDTGPEGHRGVWPDLAPRYWGSQTFEQYFRQADLWPLASAGELCLVALVEDREGIGNIEEIAQVVGLGAVLFGTGDAMVSLGGRGVWDFAAPAYVEARSRVISACRTAGVPVGLIGPAEDKTMRELIDEGFSFFVTSGDQRPTI